ncbi:MAG: hypothetical protein ACRDL8_00705 [Solirubrobacteraceae bacterium]
MFRLTIGRTDGVGSFAAYLFVGESPNVRHLLYRLCFSESRPA